MVSLEFSVT